MRIGDKVRMLRDNIEGVVVKVINQDQVEIEDSFGFGMPVLIKDLVLVNPMEDQYFGGKKGQNESVSTITQKESTISNVTKGLYLAVVEEHNNYAVYLLNNTNTKHFISVYSKKGNEFKNLCFDVVSPKSKERTGLYPLSDIDSWNSVLVGFQAKSGALTPFEQVSKKLNLSKLKSNPQDLPLIDAKGLLIQLDNELEKLDKQAIESQWSKGETLSEDIKSSLPKPKNEVDLHVDALGLDENAENFVILMGQLSAFQKKLESAIAHSMPEITFIHGVGDGKLRMEIHKRIKDYPEVKYFEDANKTKFGYGATKIVL